MYGPRTKTKNELDFKRFRRNQAHGTLMHHMLESWSSRAQPLKTGCALIDNDMVSVTLIHLQTDKDTELTLARRYWLLFLLASQSSNLLVWLLCKCERFKKKTLRYYIWKLQAFSDQVEWHTTCSAFLIMTFTFTFSHYAEAFIQSNL